MVTGVVKSYMVLKSIGKSPFGAGTTDDTPPTEMTVEGEDTDSVVTSVAIGFIGMLALAAIGSGSTYLYIVCVCVCV